MSAVSECVSDPGIQTAESESDAKEQAETVDETDEEVFHDDKSPDEGVDDTGCVVTLL